MYKRIYGYNCFSLLRFAAVFSYTYVLYTRVSLSKIVLNMSSGSRSSCADFSEKKKN